MSGLEKDWEDLACLAIENVKRLEIENKKLRECVDFYADEDRFFCHWSNTNDMYMDCIVEDQRGDNAARKCLKELENES